MTLSDGRNDEADRRRGDRAEEDRAAFAGLQFADLAARLAQFEQNLSCTSGECLAESASAPRRGRRARKAASSRSIPFQTSMREAAGWEMFRASAAAEICPCPRLRRSSAGDSASSPRAKGVIAKTITVDIDAVARIIGSYIIAMVADLPSVAPSKVILFNDIPKLLCILPLILFDSYTNSYQFAARVLVGSSSRVRSWRRPTSFLTI